MGLVRRKVQTKPTKPRSKEGLAEAKAAAKMSTEQWKKLQVGMAEKWPVPAYCEERLPDRPHNVYRDETYSLITRWHEGTQISYRPHAKAPGSKSHVRYEKYAKAKTVGQALKLGSFPQDWCWDYERGFIKVHGPVRDEPIDPSTVTDSHALTAVDTAIHHWHIRELAKKFGLDYKDLYTDKGSGESAILRAHRMVAERGARQRLEAAQRQRRRLTDLEVESTLREWAFARNSARVNVFPDGKEWVWSDNLGLTRDRLGSIHVTTMTLRYPCVFRILALWLEERLPDEMKGFRYTSMNLNCNYAARRHRDGGNFGPSMIAAFGDFTGGELNYWGEDDKSQALEDLPDGKKEQFDLKKGLAFFNGNSAHSVEDYEGMRFSVVYFAAGCFPRAKPEDKALLESLGIPFPDKDLDQFALLRPPRGYGCDRAPAAPVRNLQAAPASRYWPRKQLEAGKLRKSRLDLAQLDRIKAAGGGGPTNRESLKQEAMRKGTFKSRLKRPAAAMS